MEIRQLKTFQTVGMLLSFKRAAQVLNYAQSTVSAQIRLLEEELGVRLFDRLGKSVVLTDAGTRLMAYAARILAMAAETRARVSGQIEPEGTITIRAPQSIGTYILPGVIQRFNRACPRIGFDINDCALASLGEEFRNGVTDLAFLLQDGISSADLNAEVLGYTRILAVCAPDHPMAGTSRFALTAFHGQTLIIPTHDCSYRMDLEQQLTGQHVVPGAKILVNSIEMVRKMVENGTGIALMPEIAAKESLSRGRMAALPWPAQGGYETCVLMITHKRRWRSPHVDMFMDLIRTFFKTDPDGITAPIDTCSQGGTHETGS